MLDYVILCVGAVVFFVCIYLLNHPANGVESQMKSVPNNKGVNFDSLNIKLGDLNVAAVEWARYVRERDLALRRKLFKSNYHNRRRKR